MPTIEQDVIAGTHRARDIDDKVMLAVDALWWMLCEDAAQKPSTADVSIGAALFEYVVNGAGTTGYLGALRLAGEDADNGVKIRDLNGTGSDSEFRISVKADFNATGIAATPALVVQKRSDSGGIDDAASWTDVFAITEETIWHTDDDIDDVADALSNLGSRMTQAEANIFELSGGGSVQTTTVSGPSGSGIIVTPSGDDYQVALDVQGANGIGGASMVGDCLQTIDVLGNIGWETPTPPAVMGTYYSGTASSTDLTLGKAIPFTPYNHTVEKPAGDWRTSYDVSTGQHLVDVPMDGDYLVTVSGYFTCDAIGRLVVDTRLGTVSDTPNSFYVSITDIFGGYAGNFSVTYTDYIGGTGEGISVVVSKAAGALTAATSLRIHLSVTLVN